MPKDSGKDTITLVAPNGHQIKERYHPNEKVGHVLKKAVEDGIVCQSPVRLWTSHL